MGGAGGNRCNSSFSRCRVEHPRNPRRERRRSRWTRLIALLARGAYLKFSARTTTVSVAVACRVAGACSVLEILGANDHPVGVLGRCDVGAWSILTLARGGARNFRQDRRLSQYFGAGVMLARGTLSTRMTPLLFLVGRNAGAWSVFEIFDAKDDPVRALARGAASKFSKRMLTFSQFWAGGSTGAWSVLRILLGIDDLLAFLGTWQRRRVVRPRNSGRERRPSGGGGLR